MNSKPVVAIIMGSDSDFEIMKQAYDICKAFDVDTEVKVVSAHRTPDIMAEYALKARSRGIKVIIAGAGGAAHLPGMTASYTTLPVIGVPIKLKALDGLDSLLSIVQMPAGVPVATVSINGAKNAGLLAVRILSVDDDILAEKMQNFADKMREESISKNNNLEL